MKKLVAFEADSSGTWHIDSYLAAVVVSGAPICSRDPFPPLPPRSCGVCYPTVLWVCGGLLLLLKLDALSVPTQGAFDSLGLANCMYKLQINLLYNPSSPLIRSILCCWQRKQFLARTEVLSVMRPCQTETTRLRDHWGFVCDATMSNRNDTRLHNPFC